MGKRPREFGVRAACDLYAAKGWYAIPLLPGTKECRDKDWLDRVYVADEFNENDNLGIRLVNAADARVVKLVGLDLDLAEAVDVAEDFMPPTKAKWGRAGKKISQALYTSTFAKSVVFKDLVGGATICEIRVQHQSMAPPSTHPNGEQLFWLDDPADLDAPQVAPDELFRAAQLLSTAAVIQRYYNDPGNRHDWGLALAGLFLQLGLTQDEAVRVMRSAGKRDPELKDRVDGIRTTYNRPEGHAVRGAKSLKELSKVGQDLVLTLRRIWSGSGSKGDFRRDDKDHIVRDDQENVRRAIAKEHVTLSHDLFRDQQFIANGDQRPRPLDDAAMDRLWLSIDEHHGFRPTYEFFFKVTRDLAHQSAYHPVREYLADLRWDQTPRIDTWLVDYANAANSELTRTISALLLIAAVRRVRQPGCKFDEVAILEGGQGVGKSTLLANLCPDPNWFTDDLPLNISAKEMIERTAGKWIIEASDLAGIRKAQVEHLKATISRQVDGPVRMAYGRMSVTRPRQFIVIGTTNAHAYLKDMTGGRRFWPIRVASPRPGELEKVRDQLWAEAAARDAAGASIRLPERLWQQAALQQERRRAEDPWEAILAERFIPEAQHRLSPNDVWDALNIPVSQRDERHSDRIVAIMQHLGFRRMTVRPKGASFPMKGWGRDPEQGTLNLDGEE